MTYTELEEPARRVEGFYAANITNLAEVTKYFPVHSMVDDEVYSLDADGETGFGVAVFGDAAEWALFMFTSAGAVTEVISSSADVKWTDADGYWCIYDAGAGPAIKNRTGSTANMRERHFSS